MSKLFCDSIESEDIPPVVLPGYEVIIHCKNSAETMSTPQIIEYEIFLHQLGLDFVVEDDFDLVYVAWPFPIVVGWSLMVGNALA